MVGHGSNQCSRQNPEGQSHSLPPSFQAPRKPKGKEVMVAMDLMDDGLEARLDSSSPADIEPQSGPVESAFGPWMIVSRRKGRGGGRSGARGGAGSPASRAVHPRPSYLSNGSPNTQTRTGSSCPTRGSFSYHGRGGYSGHRARSSGPPSELAGNAIDDITIPLS